MCVEKTQRRRVYNRIGRQSLSSDTRFQDNNNILAFGV